MVSHGMAEHGGRYVRLAEALCGAGYGVFALDQRGHGRTADEGTLGLFAEQDGWNKVVGRPGQPQPAHRPATAGECRLFCWATAWGSYIAHGLPTAPQCQPAWGGSQRFEFPAGGAVRAQLG